MSAELTTYQQQQDDYQARAVARLGEWAQSADAAYHVAQRLVESSFVPAAFRGKPVEATAAILAGSEIGLQPMTALKAFDVIQGQAAPRAITLRAVVQSYGHEMVLVESTATRCRMKGRRRGSQEWQTVTWTIDRAKDLQLTSKDNWRKQPAAMLVARATSELARLIAADAILGIGYTVEEIQDGAPIETVTVVEAAEPAQVRTLSRRRPELAPVEDQPEPEPEPTTVEVPATAKQVTAINALMTDMGIKDRADKLAWLSDQIGRVIASSKEMTKDEASRVLDTIENPEPPEPEWVA